MSTTLFAVAKGVCSTVVATLLLGAVPGFSFASGGHRGSAGNFLDGPGSVLIVDGKDRNRDVWLFADGHAQDGLDFGFMQGDSFISLLDSTCTSGGSTGCHVFQGGDLVDFAIRVPELLFAESAGGHGEDPYDHDDEGTRFTPGTYRLSDPADYADQYYLRPIRPRHSRNPVVHDPYFSKLILKWDLDNDGHWDARFTLATCNNTDGMQPADPVPLPAAVWMLLPGLLAVGRFGRRRAVA